MSQNGAEFSLCENSAEQIDHVWDGEILRTQIQRGSGEDRPPGKPTEDNQLSTGWKKGAQTLLSM